MAGLLEKDIGVVVWIGLEEIDDEVVWFVVGVGNNAEYGEKILGGLFLKASFCSRILARAMALVRVVG